MVQLDRRFKKFWFVLVVFGVVLLCSTTTFNLNDLVTGFRHFGRAIKNKFLEFEFYVERDVGKLVVYSWTRKNPNVEEIMYIDEDMSVHLPSFNKSNPSKILFHGFSDHGKTGWILSFRNRYLEVGDVNVLSVESHPFSITPWYSTAAKLTRSAKLQPRC